MIVRLQILWLLLCSWFRRPTPVALPPPITAEPPVNAGPYRTAPDPVPEVLPSTMPDPAPQAPATPVLDLLAHRTLLVADVYPPDLDDPHTPQLDIPPFHALVGLKVGDKELAGCYLKATDGLGWGAKCEQWAVDSMLALRAAGGEHYGVTFHGGLYHFLRFSYPGAPQADYFWSVYRRAGGCLPGDLSVMLDMEEGGQGSWAPGPLEKCDATTKARLAGEAYACARGFVTRLRELAPGVRIVIYGRGLFRDLGMTQCDLADGVANPAYTSTMPHMDQYGVPLKRITLWQLCGDGTVYAAGYPSRLPGWGATDYSVHVNGADPTSWDTFHSACLAYAPS